MWQPKWLKIIITKHYARRHTKSISTKQIEAKANAITTTYPHCAFSSSPFFAKKSAIPKNQNHITKMVLKLYA